MKIKTFLLLIVLMNLGCKNTNGEPGSDNTSRETLNLLSTQAKSLEGEIGLSFMIDESKLALGDVLVNATITNYSEEKMSFLKWQTPFENVLLGPVYKVFFEDDAVVYKGMMVKRGHPDASQYITLAPGEQYQQTQALHLAYEMCRAGHYQIAFDSSMIFISTDDMSIAGIAAAEPKRISITMSEKLSLSLADSCAG